MRILRGILVGLAGFLLLFFMFSAITLTTLNVTVGNAARVKALLREGKVYDNVVPALLKQVAKEQDKRQDNNGDKNVPIDNPGIIAAAQKGFSPQLLQTNSEKIIDGFFAWLNGDTPTPKFNVDFTNAKNTFADGVGQYAADHLNGLPVCTSVPEAAKSRDDVLNATCRPPGINTAEQGKKIAADLKTGDFLKDAAVSDQSLKMDEKVEKLKMIPTLYQAFKISALVCGVLALLASLIIIFASGSRRNGTGRVAKALLIVGILALANVAVFAFSKSLIHHQLSNVGGQSGDFSVAVITPIADAIIKDISRVNMWFGIVLTALAVGALLALYFTGNKSKNGSDKAGEPKAAHHKNAEAKAEESQAEPDSEKDEAKKPEGDKKADDDKDDKNESKPAEEKD